MPSTRTHDMATIAQALEGTKVTLPIALKLKTAETILGLTSRKKEFGLFVILGWQRKWASYLDISDSAQDIFARERHSISEKDVRGELAATVDFDGAILIDRRGVIIHSGVMIEGMRPRAIAEKVNPGKFADLSEQLGFRRKVHTRHLTAIAASYVFKGTTVFTVSEEDDSFHIYEGGRIVYQTA